MTTCGLAPAFLVTGFSLGAQFPVLFRIVLSEVPRELVRRAGLPEIASGRSAGSKLEA